jgi:hypothetical protein
MDDADKQKLGDETDWMSTKHAPQLEPVHHPRNPWFLFRFSG